ncbi:hypothetical protein EVAR_4726_1 [Eumeta japonica]|uniref:Uncharacterized protein n=1 Tax=Eumeta variegata TaxID=151549 RepID=A0A4C1T232_EUMVA|nr:hypothetical protein EVAR_4726_1 [Eumeta japonica]
MARFGTESFINCVSGVRARAAASLLLSRELCVQELVRCRLWTSACAVLTTYELLVRRPWRCRVFRPECCSMSAKNVEDEITPSRHQNVFGIPKAAKAGSGHVDPEISGRHVSPLPRRRPPHSDIKSIAAT